MSNRSRKKTCKACLHPPAALVAPVENAEVTALSAPAVSPWFHVAIAAALTLVCIGLYARTAGFPFQFDDFMYLQNNPLSRDASSFAYLGNFREFINRPAALQLDPDLAANMAARPVSYATFYLNHLFDDYQPHWYRVINITIHAANSILIYGLVWLLVPKLTSRQFIGITAAVFFAVHPLAVESVTYIVQRMTSLATLFYLLTLWLHFRAGDVSQRSQRLALRSGALACALLGMLTKECVVTAPLMAVLLDTLVRRTPIRAAVRNAMPLLLCLPVVPGMVIAISWAQHGGTFSLAKALNIVNSKDLPIDHLHYLFTQFTVVLEYLRLTFWPTGLNIDPEWPVYRSVLAWPVSRALMIFSGLLGSAWLLYRRRTDDVRSAAVLAFIIWFFATISVSSGMVPLPDMMAEHRSYLPSIGIFIAFAIILERIHECLSKWHWGRMAIPVLILMCTAALFATAWKRNEVWRTMITLWEDTAEKSPGKFRVWGNLGGAYAIAGRLDEAVRCSRKATELEPRFVNGSVLLASVLNAQNRPQESLEEMQRLMRENPNARHLVDVQYNVGMSLLTLNRLSEGELLLLDNLKHFPKHWQSQVALGLLARVKGDFGTALNYLRSAAPNAGINPTLASVIREIEQQQSLAGP